MEKSKYKTIAISIDANLLEKVDKAADKEGRARSNMIRIMIKKYLKLQK